MHTSPQSQYPCGRCPLSVGPSEVLKFTQFLRLTPRRHRKNPRFALTIRHPKQGPRAHQVHTVLHTMASIFKVASGWRAQVSRRGQRLTRVFATKAAAEKWALIQERALIDGEVDLWPRKSVQQALDRYADEVSPSKANPRAETLRLAAFARDYPLLARKTFHEFTPSDVAAWRDDRLSKVSSSAVQRDYGLLRHVWTLGVKQWRWCPSNPWSSVKAPSGNPARDRLLGWREIRALLRRCGYRTGVRPRSAQEIVAWAFLVALRTAMRAGEVLGLTGQTVDLERRVVTLHTHKTARLVGKREVPLTPQAVRLLRVLHQDGPLLPITGASLDALFRKMRDQLLIPDAHFHDARATALTHLARRVEVLTLARISGHRDLSLLMRVYYRESAEQISARLSRR